MAGPTNAELTARVAELEKELETANKKVADYDELQKDYDQLDKEHDELQDAVKAGTAVNSVADDDGTPRAPKGLVTVNAAGEVQEADDE